MRSEEEANRAIERYSDTVRRLCMIHLKNEADTEDIFQTVFLKYVLTVPLDQLLDQPAPVGEDHREVLEAVLSLPPRYKDAVYLHYYEGYTAPEISRILGKNVNTVYTLLGRARQLLKEKLGGEGDE